MKNIRYIIFLLLVMLPINVNAAISIHCDGPAKINERISCSISSDTPINSFKSTLIVDPTVTYEGSVASTNFQQLSNGLNLNFETSNADTYKEGLVAYLTIKVPSTSKTSFALTFSSIEYTTKTTTRAQSNLTEIVQISVPTTNTTKATTSTTTQSGLEKNFVVTFDANNGTTDKQNQSCKTTGSNCKITLSNVKNPTKNGFTFNGWGNSNICTEGSKTSYTATENTTLYACWISSNNPDSGDTLYLQNLTIEGQEIDFSKYRKEYELTVLYEVESLVISATPATEGINIDLQESYPLEVGENVVFIKLSDANQNITTYTINVNRLKEGEEIRIPSSDATLKNIIIKGYELNFKPGVFEYVLQVSTGVNKLDIEPVLTNEYATYEIVGNKNISDGSIVSIKVTSETGGKINSYDIKIEVVKGIKDYLLYIVVGSVFLVSLIALVIVNQSKNQKKKGTKDNIANIAPTKKVPTKITQVEAPVVKPIPVQKAPPVQPQTGTKPAESKDSVEILDI